MYFELHTFLHIHTLFQELCNAFVSHCSIIQELTTYSHDLSMVRDESGKTPLHVACQKGHLNVVKIFKSELDPEKVKKLLDSEENTPLHLACQSNNKDVVLYLADEMKVDVNARNRKGEEPLHIAVQFASTHIVGILLNRGAKIECQDIVGCTPLHHAARSNQKDMVEFLCKR